MAKFLIIILGLLVFGNVLFNGFVWDDEELILLNAQVHSLANLPAFSAIYTLFGPNAHSQRPFALGHFRSLPLALIFLVHPLNTETVVYLADYQEVLFFFFGIVSFWYLLKTKSPNLFLAAGESFRARKHTLKNLWNYLLNGGQTGIIWGRSTNGREN